MSEPLDAALQRAIADACLGADAGEEIAKDLRGWLQKRGVPADDVEAILAAPPRLGVYRSLVRNGLSSVVLRMLPRTRARMNVACGGRFDQDLAAFVDEVGPRTHYLRDVPAEYLAWAGPRWRADPGVPGYLPDLATHEVAQFAVGAAAAALRAPEVAEVGIDRPLAFLESLRILHHDWAVHELSADEDAVDAPARRDVHLLAYRDADHVVRWLEVTPLAAAILALLVAGEPLGEAVGRACATASTAPAAVLTDIARLLADLGERGVLLGARE
ncbi:MAG TPA: DUF2063 domain-containing protein [Polyangiaceae bacterium]